MRMRWSPWDRRRGGFRTAPPPQPPPPSILVTARPVVDTYTPAPVARYGAPEFATGIGDAR